MKTLLVSGSRGLRGPSIESLIRARLAGCDLLLCGDACGVDECAAQVARSLNVPARIFRADWIRHRRAAGVLRNCDMVAAACELAAAGGSVSVLAIVPADRYSAGTMDCIARARKAGLSVEVVSIDLPGQLYLEL